MDPSIQNILDKQKSYQTFLGGLGTEQNQQEVKDYYNKWSIKYDEDVETVKYRGPKIATNLCEIFVGDKNAKILDVGSGTGLIGKLLANSGFKFIDGLEPSENMVAVAESTRSYRKFFLESIEADKETSLPKEFYDVCVTCGSFLEGHIPSKGIYEMLRVVKPSGYIIVVIRKEVIEKVKEYMQLEPLMEKIENMENLWRLVTKFDVDYYTFNKSGRVYVFRKN